MGSKSEASATAAGESRPAAKRLKTGGRAKAPSIQEQLETAKLQSEIGALNDDTLLTTELAALYLGIKVKTLEEMRGPIKKGGAQTRGVEGPPFEKIIGKGDVGQNQPVHYALGQLRAWRKKNSATTSHQAALNAGLFGFVSTQLPFFAEAGERKRNARDILIAGAWDVEDSKREERFKDLFEGRLRVVWLSPMEAAASRWANLDAHKRIANLAIALMKEQRGAVDAALEFTEISAETRSALD